MSTFYYFLNIFPDDDDAEGFRGARRLLRTADRFDRLQRQRRPVKL